MWHVEYVWAGVLTFYYLSFSFFILVVLFQVNPFSFCTLPTNIPSISNYHNGEKKYRSQGCGLLAKAKISLEADVLVKESESLAAKNGKTTYTRMSHETFNC